MPGAKPGIFVSGSLWGSRLAARAAATQAAQSLWERALPAKAILWCIRQTASTANAARAAATKAAQSLWERALPAKAAPRFSRHTAAFASRAEPAPTVHLLPQFICSHSSSASTIHLLPQFICSHSSSASTIHLLPQFTCFHNSPASHNLLTYNHHNLPSNHHPFEHPATPRCPFPIATCSRNTPQCPKT